MPIIQILDYLILNTKLLISMSYCLENHENPKYFAIIKQSQIKITFGLKISVERTMNK